MVKEQLIRALKLIENDLSENSTLYDEVQLAQVVSQFQGKILALRNNEQRLLDSLKMLSLNDLKDVINEINLCLLPLPAQKGKLISLLSSIILQEGKETQLLQIINKFNFLRTSYKKSDKNETDVLEITPENIDKIRNEWLAHDTPEYLAEEMDRIKLSDLRIITKPWKIKSRSKDGLIYLTINYLENLCKFNE